MVSFERVFEVIDLPVEIDDRPEAMVLQNANGELIFEDVSFDYDARTAESAEPGTTAGADG